MAIQLIYRRFFRESEAKQSFRILLTKRPKARISISMASHSACCEADFIISIRYLVKAG